MRIAVAALLTPLLACGSSPTTHLVPGEVEARFATSSGQTLTLWRSTAAGVAPEQRLELPDPIEDIGWLDANTPVVMFEGQRVARVVDGKLVAFPQAPATAWVEPRPTGPDLDSEALQPGSSPDQLFTFDGQVWIMRCLWELPYDGGYCETIRWVRIHPSFEQQDEAPNLPPLRELPSVAAPSGYVVETLDVPRVESQAEPTRTVRCAKQGDPSSEGRLPLLDHDAESEAFAEMFEASAPKWIRASPPRFIVTAVVPGMDAHEATVVVDGCPAITSRIIREHRVGPGGLWAWHNYESGWQLEGAANVPPSFAVDHLEFAPTR